METKPQNSILFAPVGTTDPVREYHDGPILHIIRHYKPQKVLLYYTQEMQMRHKQLVQGIQEISDCIIEPPIFTDIAKANDYDIFINSIPPHVDKFREANPDATLLLNLTSGTTQIQTVMSILATELPNTKGIQVSSPNNASNVNKPPLSDPDEIAIHLELNQDKEKNINRCHEPALHVIRRYALYQQILTLCHNTDYQGALQIVNQNPIHFTQETKNLLKHTVYRDKMQLKESEKILSKYEGKNLYPIKDPQAKELTEYYLIMQNRQKKQQLSELIVKITPFLYVLLKHYLEQCKQLKLNKITQKIPPHRTKLIAEKMREHTPGLYNKFKTNYPEVKDVDLAPRNMIIICQYIQEQNLANDPIAHTEIINQLDRFSANLWELRNSIAHTTVDLDETKFRATTNLTSQEAIHSLYRIMCLVFGEKMKGFRDYYQDLNKMIERSIKKQKNLS